MPHRKPNPALAQSAADIAELAGNLAFQLDKADPQISLGLAEQLKDQVSRLARNLEFHLTPKGRRYRVA